jgi:endonuclease-3
MRKKERYSRVLAFFEGQNPVPETELEYSSAYELIVAVVLSAQCTDTRVNLITPGFFKAFPDEKVLAAANVNDVFEKIKSCSYPNNKAKNLIGMAKMLVEKFNCMVPSNIEELQELPGVGRKTANVISSVVYQQPTMAVDTHIFRVAARIGLTTNARNPYETEMQLVKYIPEEKIRFAHHWLLLHGRYICKARNPLCTECGLNEQCKYFERLGSKRN